jgi:hypothetical protein
MEALKRVPEKNKLQTAILSIFVSFCQLVAEEPGQIPFGPILGYLAQVGGKVQVN